MTQKRDFFNQSLEPGDKVITFDEWGYRDLRIAEVIRLTPNAVLITGRYKKPVYVKSYHLIKMTPDLEALNTYRLLVK